MTVLDTSWMAYASCRKLDPEIFFPQTDDDTPTDALAALRVCRHCPVQERCLAYSFQIDARVGIWGGYQAKARGRMRNRRIDRHRPLGQDGKHGNRHTEHCGCERPRRISNADSPSEP